MRISDWSSDVCSSDLTSTFVVRPSIRWTPGPDLDITLLGEFYHQYGDPVVVRGVSPNTVPGGPLTLPEKEGYVTPSDYFTVSPGDEGFSNEIGRAHV